MTTHYSRLPYDPETGCSGLECVGALALDHAFVALWIGCASLVVFGLVTLPKAREICATERDRTRREAEAFERFARRLERIDTAPAAAAREPAPTQRARAVVGSEPTGGAIRAARTAYRETVMAVSHYDEEYDESLAGNVAGEFDPDAAAALAGSDSLTPQVERALIRAARDASEGRMALLPSIEGEIDALERHERVLSSVERSLARLDERSLSKASFDELSERFRENEGLRARIEADLADRQEELRERIEGFPSRWEMDAYVYQSAAMTHPVLKEGTRLLERASDVEGRLTRALTETV